MWGTGYKSQSKPLCQKLAEETWRSHGRKLVKRRRACVEEKID